MSDEGAGLVTKRRTLIVAVGLVVPVLLLTGLAAAAIRNDRTAFEVLQIERQRRLLEQVNGRVARGLAEAKFELFGALEPVVRGPREELGERLAELEQQAGIVRGFFCVDARHELVFPRPEWPFHRAAAGDGSELSRIRRTAELSRVEGLTKSLETDVGLTPEDRLARLALLESSEAPDSDARMVLAFARAEILVELKRLAEARPLLETIRDHPRSLALADGREPRIEARLALAAAETPTGAELDAAAQRRAAIAEDLMAGRAAEISESAFKDALGRALALVEAAARRRGPDSDAARQAARLRSRVETFRRRLAWKSALVGELGQELQRLSPDPSPTGEWDRRITLYGRRPLLLCYRAITLNEGSSHVFVGFQLDLEKLVQRVLAPVLEAIPVEPGLSFTLVGPGEREFVTNGAMEDGPRPAPLTRSLEAMPLWQLKVERDPRAIDQAATTRALILGGLITLALCAVVFGAWSTMRFVRQSLELARLKSDFVSNITHELKTPLTSIQMFAEMLSLGRIKSDEKRQEYHQHIISETQRLRRMIDDILDFARSESGRVQYVLSEDDVSEMVQDAIDLFTLSAEAKGFSIRAELPGPGELPPVDLDREACVRVILNLLSNAVKYSLEASEIVVTVVRDGDNIRASVQDYGVGIDPENLRKIFDKFFREGDPLTREVSGTGLGLALVDSIVKAHHGRVEVESAKGTGSTFHIRLPIVAEYREQWPPPQAAEPEGVDSEAGVSDESEVGPDDASVDAPSEDSDDARQASPDGDEARAGAEQAAGAADSGGG